MAYQCEHLIHSGLIFEHFVYRNFPFDENVWISPNMYEIIRSENFLNRKILHPGIQNHPYLESNKEQKKIRQKDENKATVAVTYSGTSAQPIWRQ